MVLLTTERLKKEPNSSTTEFVLKYMASTLASNTQEKEAITRELGRLCFKPLARLRRAQCTKHFLRPRLAPSLFFMDLNQVAGHVRKKMVLVRCLRGKVPTRTFGAIQISSRGVETVIGLLADTMSTFVLFDKAPSELSAGLLHGRVVTAESSATTNAN